MTKGLIIVIYKIIQNIQIEFKIEPNADWDRKNKNKERFPL